jgi:AraC-like DNA-binding protein
MEWSQVHARPDLPGLELLKARFVRHRYSRHAHEHAVIGLVETGVQAFTYRGSYHRTGPNGLFFVNPEEAHTGEADTADGYAYRSLYPGTDFLGEIFKAENLSRLLFREPVIYEPVLVRKVRAVHLAVEAGEPTLTCETLALDAVTSLLRRNGAVKPPPAAASARAAVDRVRAAINSEPLNELSLGQLGRLAGFSPYHLAHLFVRQVGSSIFVYAEAVRIQRAKRLLSSGVPLAQVALQLGYADQSHFTRRFKQHQGLTPRQYRQSARSCKIAGVT